jgi:DNA-binding transcriptional ArsR family regulator
MTGIRLRRGTGRDTRLDVFFEIEHEAQTVAQVSESLGLPVSVVGYHLEVLRRAGLAEKASGLNGVPLYVALSEDQR